MWDSNPFDEREVPPMSAEMFSAVVTSRLRAVPDIEIRGGKGLELQLRVRGQDRLASLNRAYERYRVNRAELNPIVDDLIRGLERENRTGQAGIDEPPSSDEFARIQDRLFPLLISAREWTSKREAGLRLIVRPVVQELGMALVVDEGDEFRFVELDAVPRWGIDAETAYERARLNLDKTLLAAGFSEFGEGTAKLLIDRATDGYAATRVMAPARVADWGARVTGELVLGLPQRDLLIGFSSEHPAFDELAEQVAQDAAHGSHTLIPNLLVFRNGTLTIL